MNTLPYEITSMILDLCNSGMVRSVCRGWRDLSSVRKIACRNLVISQNYVGLLTWAFSEGCPKSYKLYLICCRYELWHVVRWLRSVGTPWNHKVMNAFASDYDTLVWSYNHGWVTGNKIWVHGIKSDDVRVIKFLHEVGVYKPANSAFLRKIRNVEVLKYLHTSVYNTQYLKCNAPSIIESDSVALLEYLQNHNIDISTYELSRVGPNLVKWFFYNGHEAVLNHAKIANILRTNDPVIIRKHMQSSTTPVRTYIILCCIHDDISLDALHIIYEYRQTPHLGVLHQSFAHSRYDVIEWLVAKGCDCQSLLMNNLDKFCFDQIADDTFVKKVVKFLDLDLNTVQNMYALSHYDSDSESERKYTSPTLYPY
jgi:hypothetical protein